jgi:hypothetical protein
MELRRPRLSCEGGSRGGEGCILTNWLIFGLFAAEGGADVMGEATGMNPLLICDASDSPGV